VAGRDRTCGAPRFKRALYRLSYGHMLLCEGSRGNLPVPPDPFPWSAPRTDASGVPPDPFHWSASRTTLCVGRRALLPSTGAERCSNAFRSHRLPVGAPASHRRGPPGRCPLPLATPDARYGPRSASASAVLPSLPWATRRRPNLPRFSVHLPRREIDAAARSEPSFPSHSPTLRPWIAFRRPTWRGFGARCLVRS
jgi:hypothetical protein